MKLHRWLSALTLALAGQASMASGFALLLSDSEYAGVASRIDVLGECQTRYVPYRTCYDELGFSVEQIAADDHRVTARITDVRIATGSSDHDWFVRIRDLGGSNAVDDVLRVRVDVLDTPAGIVEGLPMSLAEITLDLVSGPLVANYLAGLPASSLDRGTEGHRLNEELEFRSGVFSTDLSLPRQNGSGDKPIYYVAVSAADLPEPATAALALGGLLALAAFRSRARSRAAPALSERTSAPSTAR